MKKGFGAAALTAFFLTVLTLSASAERLKEVKVDYTADSVLKIDGMEVISRVYHSGSKERMEQEMDGAAQVIIVRTDKKLAWVLMPQMQMYMEIGYDALGAAAYDPGEMDYTLVAEGTESVAGVTAAKYRMTAVGRDGKRFEGYIWLGPGNIMVRIEAASKGNGKTERVKMELRNLRIGPVDRSLFEVPKGYTKMQGMGGGLQETGR